MNPFYENLKIFNTGDTGSHRVKLTGELWFTLCFSVYPVFKLFYLAYTSTAAPMFSMMQSANSLVFTLVAPSMRRSKSYVTFF